MATGRVKNCGEIEAFFLGNLKSRWKFLSAEEWVLQMDQKLFVIFLKPRNKSKIGSNFKFLDVELCHCIALSSLSPKFQTFDQKSISGSLLTFTWVSQSFITYRLFVCDEKCRKVVWYQARFESVVLSFLRLFAAHFDPTLAICSSLWMLYT